MASILFMRTSTLPLLLVVCWWCTIMMPLSDGFTLLGGGQEGGPSSRRQVLIDASTSALAILVVGTCSTSSPAMAAYGESPSIQGFDYIEFLMEKNAVSDPSTYLYQGADREIQLKRILEAAQSLQKIPDISANKKWSQVQGILTGPLGTLVATMNAVATTKEAKAASQKVKADLYTIGDAAVKKSATGCSQATDQALNDLKAFVKVAF